ncbi:MAG: trypsin-like peptidase domain-containing protein [Myxococcaceae bacterium]|nr:trypsin-like peptidase domain-containing protein [Myxococcaceae bacterium]
MADSIEARCLRCGAPDAGDRAQCVCGASLLVDVLLKEAVEDERRRFGLARALALLGPPAPAFSQARTALATPGERLARGVSRAFAQKILAVLSEHGASASLQPVEEPAVTPPSPARGGRVAALAVLILGGVAFGVWASRSPEFLRAVRAVSPGVAGLMPEEASAERGLSTQEISQLASPSTLSLRCGGKTGSGFFVDKELALTNEHVVCPPGKTMTVVLPDGRQLIGETIEFDVDLDLATVRVVGANATPLKLGDVTLLRPGDPLVFIGSPKGLDFTVHEGKVGFVGREYLGTGYVQFNASVNPGNSGGPLLNGRGEVVGVVSMKIENADGLGLALPIPYASKLIPVSSTPEATGRWQELLARVARDEERELQRFREEMSQPALISVRRVEKLGLVALLVERFEAPPQRVKRRLEMGVGREICTLDVDFEYWRPMQESMAMEEDSRRLRWYISRGLTEGVHVGAARLPVEDCSLAGTGSAWLKVGQGGGEELDRVQVSLRDVQAAREEFQRNKVGIQSWEKFLGQQRLNEETRRQDAEEWRSNFRRARERIARLEEEKRRLEQEEAAGRRVSKRRKEVEEELKLANAQLAELDRYATQKRVPEELRK